MLAVGVKVLAVVVAVGVVIIGSSTEFFCDCHCFHLGAEIEASEIAVAGARARERMGSRMDTGTGPSTIMMSSSDSSKEAARPSEVP